MSLSGNLGFVSLDEVLRLLTRSEQLGSVDVSGESTHGRIFVIKGGITLATTSDDDGLRRLFFKSGFIDDGTLADIEAGNTTMASVMEKGGGAIAAFIREMTVESIYQLGLNGVAFEVFPGQESRYASPQPFDLESLIADSKKRLADWADLSKVVTDLYGIMKFTRDLGDREEVSINRESWRVLSEVGDGASVNSMADDLGTTEFWTARVAARLIEDELLTLQRAETSQPEEAPVVEAPVMEPAVEELPAVEPVAVEPVAVEPVAVEPVAVEPVAVEPVAVEPVAVEPVAVEPVAEEAPVVEPAGDAPQWAAAPVSQDPSLDVDPSQSWWEEPADETDEGESAEAPAPAAAMGEDNAQESPILDSPDTSELEEDTEAFLEKVFSELDDSSDSSDPEGEDAGYGLLRRRSMGAMRDHGANE